MILVLKIVNQRTETAQIEMKAKNIDISSNPFCEKRETKSRIQSPQLVMKSLHLRSAQAIFPYDFLLKRPFVISNFRIRYDSSSSDFPLLLSFLSTTRQQSSWKNISFFVIKKKNKNKYHKSDVIWSHSVEVFFFTSFLRFHMKCVWHNCHLVWFHWNQIYEITERKRKIQKKNLIQTIKMISWNRNESKWATESAKLNGKRKEILTMTREKREIQVDYWFSWRRWSGWECDEWQRNDNNEMNSTLGFVRYHFDCCLSFFGRSKRSHTKENSRKIESLIFSVNLQNHKSLSPTVNIGHSLNSAHHAWHCFCLVFFFDKKKK